MSRVLLALVIGLAFVGSLASAAPNDAEAAYVVETNVVCASRYSGTVYSPNPIPEACDNYGSWYFPLDLEGHTSTFYVNVYNGLIYWQVTPTQYYQPVTVSPGSPLHACASWYSGIMRYKPVSGCSSGEFEVVMTADPVP